MCGKVLLAGVLCLVLSSDGVADCGIDCDWACFAVGWGAGYVGPAVAGPVFCLGPDGVLIFGSTGPHLVAGPGPNSATVVQSTYTASSQTSDAGAQGTCVAGWQVTFVSGDGIVWMDSDVVAATWQNGP